MRAFFERITGVVVRFLQRFINNQPINPYEEVAFMSVRAVAAIFGRKVVLA